MKNVLIVFVVISLQQVVFGVFTEDELPHTQKECLKEFNLPVELLLTNFHEDFTVTEDVADVNKVMLCAAKKHNFVTEDNTMDTVKYHHFYSNEFMQMANIKVDNPEEVATKAMESCKDVQGTDLGDTMVKSYNCISKYLTKL